MCSLAYLSQVLVYEYTCEGLTNEFFTLVHTSFVEIDWHQCALFEIKNLRSLIINLGLLIRTSKWPIRTKVNEYIRLGLDQQQYPEFGRTIAPQERLWQVQWIPSLIAYLKYVRTLCHG